MKYVIESWSAVMGIWSARHLNQSAIATGFRSGHPEYETRAAAEKALAAMVAVGWSPDRLRVAEVTS